MIARSFAGALESTRCVCCVGNGRACVTRRDEITSGVPITSTLLAIVGGLSIAAMFTIESGAWFLRAQASQEEMGRMLSTANQFLFTSRLFAFGFQAVTSLMVDRSLGWNALNATFLIGFGVAAVIHLLAYHCPPTARWTRQWFLLMLPKVRGADHSVFHPRARVMNKSLFLRAVMATLLFSLAFTVPWLLANRFHSIRMTMGSVSQMMNFLGSITLVTLVEPILYRAIDGVALRDVVYDYLLGRFWAFTASFAVVVAFQLL